MAHYEMDLVKKQTTKCPNFGFKTFKKCTILIRTNVSMQKQKSECTLKMISLSFIYSIQIHEIQWWLAVLRVN